MGAVHNLVVLVADLDIEKCVEALLKRFPNTEGISEFHFDIVRHPMRDAGCYNDPEKYLRLYNQTHHNALVIFDREGCGKENQTREMLESSVKNLVGRNGWNERVECIVIDPEIENWIWVDSPKMAETLNWPNMDAIREYLNINQFWPIGESKPPRPKEALEFASRKSKVRLVPSIYESIAAKASFRSCTSPSFIKFKDTIVRWFTPENP